MKKWIYNEEFITSNVEEVLIQSTSSDFKEAKLWYPTARNYAMDFSQEFNIPFENCCALISVLSPQKEWFQNLELTKEFLKSGGKRVRHTSVQKAKAKNIYRSTNNVNVLDLIIGGRKTTNFFRNILSPTDNNYITLDSHMIQVCTGKMEEKDLTVNQYDYVAGVLKSEAKKLNLHSSEFQSILWLTWKRIKPRYNENKNT